MVSRGIPNALGVPISRASRTSQAIERDAGMDTEYGVEKVAPQSGSAKSAHAGGGESAQSAHAGGSESAQSAHAGGSESVSTQKRKHVPMMS